MNNQEELKTKIMGKVNLTKDKVALEKHIVSLSKCVSDISNATSVDLGNIKAKVVAVLDYSGSMSSLYDNGTVQNTINKLIPLGLTFDDNGSVDVYLFQDDYKKINDLDLSNYESYVKNIINKSGYNMGGTCYAPVLNSIINGDKKKISKFFGFRSKTVGNDAMVDNETPTFVLFITDGENSDKSATDNIIRKSSEMNVFIQFIGIGSARFNYLRALDDMQGRKKDNTGFSQMKDLNSVSDEELYNNVLGQFAEWLKGNQ